MTEDPLAAMADSFDPSAAAMRNREALPTGGADPEAMAKEPGAEGGALERFRKRLGKGMEAQQKYGKSSGAAPRAAPQLVADRFEGTDMAGYARASQVFESSKKVKTQGRGLGGLVQKGLDGSDPISANGVKLAAIQELSRRIKAAEAQLDALKKRKAKR